MDNFPHSGLFKLSNIFHFLFHFNVELFMKDESTVLRIPLSGFSRAGRQAMLSVSKFFVDLNKPLKFKYFLTIENLNFSSMIVFK